MGRRTGYGRTWKGHSLVVKTGDAKPGDGKDSGLVIPDDDPLLAALIREHDMVNREEN